MILHNNVLGRFLILIGLILVIAQPVISIEKDRIYQVFLKYSDNNISLDSIIVTVGFYDKNPIQQGDYQAELISFSEEILYTIYFDFNLETSASALPEWFDEDGTQIYFPGKSLTLNETTEQVIIPYFSNGKKINIYDPNNAKVLDIDVAYFADVCGDNICQDHENYGSCSLDCSSGSYDDYCDGAEDGICDIDCLIIEDVDCSIIVPGETKGKYYSFPIIIGLTILVIVIIIIFLELDRLKYHKNLKENYRIEKSSELKNYIVRELRKGYTKEQIRNTLIKSGWSNKEIEEAFKISR